MSHDHDDRCVLGNVVAFILTVGQEGSPTLIEIDGGSDIIRAVTFAANGEYLVSGASRGVRVWQVEDGKQMATVEANVWCLAVSKDGRWIAGGTRGGNVFVWDAETYEEVISELHKEDDHYHIYGVDFSPDSTRLVSASYNGTATIWDIASRKRLQTLDHGYGNGVRAAKYSPQGDRIATANSHSVRLWDSNDGRLLLIVKANVNPLYNTGLLWFNNHLFVASESKIKKIESSTGSTVSEWPVPDSLHLSCIALPKHGEFIAYSTPRTVTFWDTTTHTQLGFIQHPQEIRSIAVSPDDRFLAIGGEDGKITITSLSHPSRISVIILSRWIVVHVNNCHSFTAFNPFVSSTPHIPGTRHFDRRRYAPLLEAQSTWKCGSIIDRSNPRVSESNLPCARLSSSRESTSAAVGCCHCRCYRGVSCSALPRVVTNLSSPSKFSPPSLATLQRV